MLRPRDTEEVAGIVRQAYERGEKVKALGALLSWSEATDCPGKALLMERMARVVAVDREAKKVRVEAGARLKNVNEVLYEHGLAFENFGSITEQTVGGYIGTGSHGTGALILAARVLEMTLVDGTGEVRVLSASSQPDIFRFARVHLGCLGVVTEVVFACEEAFWLEERLELLDFDRVLGDLESLVKSNDYVKLWWFPYQAKVQVYRYNRTEERVPRMGFRGFIDKIGASGMAFSGLIGFSKVAPRVIPPLLGLVQALHFRPRRRVNRSDRIIPYGGSIPRHQETEYAVPREVAPKVIEEIRRAVTRRDAPYRVNFPLEVRFVPADDCPMSPAFQRDSCFIGPYVASRSWAQAYFREAEAIFKDYQGRPHWGKHFSLTPADFARLYPEYRRFQEVRHHLDPAGLFANAFTERVFGSEAG